MELFRLIIVETKIWSILPILQMLRVSWDCPKSEAFTRVKYRAVEPAALQAEVFELMLLTV